MSRTSFFFAWMPCLVAMACPVAAGDITIYNHSFQSGGMKTIDIPDWIDVDMTPDAPADSPWSVYQEGPDAANFFNGVGVDGDQFALIDAGGFYAAYNTADMFVSGASYDLTVGVGRRQDHDDLGWNATPWRISLNYADGTEVASLSGLIDLGAGGAMSDQTLHYVAQPQDVGQAIQVRIGGSFDAGSTAGYDNVRLTTDAAITPPPVGTILNYSFEEGEKLADIPMWGDGEVEAYGVYQEGPDAENFFAAGGVDGSYFALVDAGLNNYAYQYTSTTFQTGESYDLVVAVGRRKDHDDLGWDATPWRISLHYMDGTEVAALSGLIDLGGGGAMSDQTLRYVAQPQDAGQRIQVRIGGTAEAGSTAGYDNVRLIVGSTPVLLGDLNGDGMVGSADLDIVRANWGAGVDPGCLTCGDPSGDGMVGSADLDVVRANWGASAAAAVPEPVSGSLLLILGTLGLVARRRR